MVAMAVLVPLAYADRSQILTCQDIVENGADAANRETEDQALYVKSGSLRQIEKTGRIPI
jgi:hypothetical protein